MVHPTALVSTFSAFLVFLVGYVRTISARAFMWLAVVSGFAAGLLVIASPTPPGYDPNAMPARLGGAVMAFYGPHAAAVLLAVCSAALLCAAGFRRTDAPIEV